MNNKINSGEIDYNKINSSFRNFNNINISNFSKNEFNFSKLYQKICPKKKNKSLNRSCFSFNSSYLNIMKSSYLKKDHAKNKFQNNNNPFKNRINEYNF